MFFCFFFPSFVHRLDQTASSCWFLKTSRTKCRVTRRGWAPHWRRSAGWRWDSGTKVWHLLWPSSAWPRPPCWASTVRRPCWRGRPACDTASVKVSRTGPLVLSDNPLMLWSCVNNAKSDPAVISEQVPAANWIHPSCCGWRALPGGNTAVQKKVITLGFDFFFFFGPFEVGNSLMKTCQDEKKLRLQVKSATAALIDSGIILCTRSQVKKSWNKSMNNWPPNQSW